MASSSVAPPRTDHARGARALRDLIERGVYAPGERLPSERDLAESLGLARHAMRQALTELTDDGWIASNGARMRFVAPRPPIAGATGLLSGAVFTIAQQPQGPLEDHRQSGWMEWVDVGVQSQLKSAGWHGLSLHPDRLRDEWQRILAERPVGVVVTYLASRQQENTVLELLHEFKRAQIPVVVYGDEAGAEAFDRVVGDHRAGSALLTRYFVERELGPIAMVCGPSDDYNWYRARRAGYQDALREADWEPLPLLQIPYKPYHFAPGEWEADVRLVAGYLFEWFDKFPQTEVLQAASDASVPLLGAALTLLKRQLKRDVRLAGYDNTWRETEDYPHEPVTPCATVDKRNRECGAEMMRLLRQRIQGELPPEPQLRLVEPQLVLPDQSAGQ